jgi:hypothetical protein
MKTADRFRQVWPDTETPEPVPPKRPLWRAVAAVAYCINVAAVAAMVYFVTVVLFSL